MMISTMRARQASEPPLRQDYRRDQRDWANDEAGEDVDPEGAALALRDLSSKHGKTDEDEDGDDRAGCGHNSRMPGGRIRQSPAPMRQLRSCACSRFSCADGNRVATSRPGPVRVDLSASRWRRRCSARRRALEPGTPGRELGSAGNVSLISAMC